MVSSDFVHLHLHTQYSLLDGAIRLDDLFAKVKDYGMHSIAITDHGGMFGLVDFYLKAKENGIKPILGCEFYITPGSRFEKDANGKQNTLFHLILLAKDREGYKNLVKLSTASYLEGFYYKPRIDKELLKQHTKGLVALSACLKGEIPSLILRGDMKGARNVALEFKEIFCDGFFLELQHNGMKEQKIVNKGILDLGKELEIPVVATNDCHYLNKNDARAHDVLLCIQTGKTISDENRLRFSTDQLYVRSQEEMASLFSYCPESIKNTLVIAEMCNVELELGVPHFPNFPLPEGETPNRCLERETYEGFKKRVLEGTINGEKEKYEKRLKRELEVIQSTGFASYFLIVSDFARYARVQGIPIGPGRGSVAGSLIAYCLGITNIDPLAYNLLFERFLNPERISLPDIDIDFCIEGRETIIEYLSQKYGKDNVSQIATFGTMQAKLAVRDTGRALNFSTKEVDNIAKMIPNVLNITLETAISQEKSLKELFSSDEKVTKLLTMASRLEGLTRHASTHAAGIVISDKPLVEYLPLFKGTHGEIVSQYHMGSIEKIGLIKFDILGLKTLTVIEDTKKNIKESTGFDIYLDKIDMTDRATFDLLCSGETTGIFQLESSGMRDLIVRLKPESFEDIIALVGLYRPGPLGSGMVDEFIKRKRSKETLTYTIPQLEPILKDTYGVIVYQEQVMQIASTLANFSLGEADMLRRAMGKKKPEEMEMQRDRFISGALENGISLKDAKQLFEQMSMFAGYGFNRSHSAAYAMITYQTAYLKAHYPVELMAALLTSDMNRTDKIMRYISECRETGIEILAPDVNQSFTHFTVSEGKIRFGLAAVKNIGKQAVDSIVLERKQNDAFHSFHDFCCRVNPRNVNKKVLESLIKCGAFDFTQYNRPQLLSIMELEMEHGQKMQDRKSVV